MGWKKIFQRRDSILVKMWDNYNDLVLHYDMTKSICCDQDCKRCKEDMVKDLSGNDNHGTIHKRYKIL